MSLREAKKIIQREYEKAMDDRHNLVIAPGPKSPDDIRKHQRLSTKAENLNSALCSLEGLSEEDMGG